MSAWRHWVLERPDGGPAVLTLAVADRGVNVLHRAALDELEEIAAELEAAAPAGVLLRSTPGRAFCAGADVREFARLRDAAEARELLRRGQELFARWQALPCPTAAVLRGYCLGGGLELALACTYLIADADPGLKLGLPEVRLGIHPGYGGTVRLPRRVGDRAALRLMLAGRTLGGRAALRLGLVDAVAPERGLEAAARALLEERPRPRRAAWWKRLPHAAWLRAPVVRQAGRTLRRRARPEHYPAPWALLDCWRRAPRAEPAALAAEADSVAALFDTKAARQLTRLFLLREELKRAPAAAPEPPAHVHVIGAGAMGGDIAAWCAARGLRVTLQDADPERLAPAFRRAERLFARHGPRRARAMRDRLIPDPDGCGAAAADLVLEAIVEDAAAKRELYRTLEPRLRPEALLATNTSSLRLEELAAELARPERLVGVHFFNPVARMPLVEVIRHHPAQQAGIDQARAFARRLGKAPVVVRSAPGFLVNRALLPYLLEAVRLLEEGAAAAAVDRAAKDYGMPMGPLELADLVGLDVCLAAGSELAARLGGTVPERLREQVEAGRLGRKTGRGFHVWKQGRARVGRAGTPPPDCQDRLLLSLAREAVHCWHERLVERADWVDAALVLGAGFAPHRGGPLQAVREEGADAVRRRLEGLARRCGERFEPGEGWDAPELGADWRPEAAGFDSGEGE